MQLLSCCTTHCLSTPWSIAVSLELKYSLLEGGEAPETRGSGRGQTNITLGKAERVWKSPGNILLKVKQKTVTREGETDQAALQRGHFPGPLKMFTGCTNSSSVTVHLWCCHLCQAVPGMCFSMMQLLSSHPRSQPVTSHLYSYLEPQYKLIASLSWILVQFFLQVFYMG